MEIVGRKICDWIVNISADDFIDPREVFSWQFLRDTFLQHFAFTSRKMYPHCASI